MQISTLMTDANMSLAKRAETDPEIWVGLVDQAVGGDLEALATLLECCRKLVHGYRAKWLARMVDADAEVIAAFWEVLCERPANRYEMYKSVSERLQGPRREANRYHFQVVVTKELGQLARGASVTTEGWVAAVESASLLREVVASAPEKVLMLAEKRTAGDSAGVRELGASSRKALQRWRQSPAGQAAAQRWAA